MNIEEIIKKLDKLAKKHERCADSPSLAPIAPVYLDTAQVLRAAIEKLKTHPDNQSNEPLTLEEAKRMVGQPAYFAEDRNWLLIDHIAICAVKVGAKLYRRPPKEET